MPYSSFKEFHDDILRYLQCEKQYYEEDIKANEGLSDAQKIEAGLLIEKAILSLAMHPYYILSVSENNTKLRPGDKVTLVQGNQKREVRIVENAENTLTVESLQQLSDLNPYRIEVHEFVLLDPLIQLTEQLEEGASGSFWMQMLAGIEEPVKDGYKPIDSHAVNTVPASLNDGQYQCCKNVFQRPTFYCLQGPPGTGKTNVLATLANVFSSQGYEVLIVSNTHQAVNNALNKIHSINRQLPVVKIGEKLKGEGLDEGIMLAQTYNAYLSSRKQQKKKKKKERSHDIVGMTFQAAVINLGLRKTEFLPSIILVDEAGQMPLSQGALIGAFGSGTVVLIGDDLQMPPIYHPKLADDKLSVSIFTYLCRLYPQLKNVLTVTYRMNKEITEAVSQEFYQPFGITLTASEYSANRTLVLQSSSGDERIDSILNSPQSIRQLNVSKDESWQDDNHEEAKFISLLIKAAVNSGMNTKDIAVITPYRRQVKAIRQYAVGQLGRNADIPLIDTVERLQGQDVDMIIISLSITDTLYWKQQEQFVLNPNRLNVMLSRAKKKVVIIGKYKLFQ